MKRVPTVTDHTHQRQAGEALARVQLDGVEVVLTQLVQHDARRCKARQLPAQLAADAAAGTGDQHGLAGQYFGNAGKVKLHWLAAQQVFGLDVAHALDGALAVAQFGGRGHGEHGQA